MGPSLCLNVFKMMMAIINLINQYSDQDVKRDDVYDLHPQKVKTMD